MRKDRVLRNIVAVQALCMILLAVVVSIKVLVPVHSPKPNEAEDPGSGASAAAGDGDGVAATIGSDTITQREFLAELRRQYGSAVLRTMMLRKVVRMEAQADGLSVTGPELEDELRRLMEGYESEDAYYEAMRRQLGMSRTDVQADTEYRLLLEKIATRDITVTDDEVQAYIAEHPEEFEPETQLRLSWIVTAAKEEAEDVLEMAGNGEDFAELARIYSTDAYTKDNGGDLGSVDAEDPFLNADMMEAARSMEVGQIGGPVQTDEGWAVFQLTERNTTSGPEGSERNEAVRRQIALSEAPPLTEVEDDLLARYGAQPADLPEP